MFTMFIDVNRSSSAVSALSVDLLSQRALVTFKNGYIYEYKNVSKRAIANVLFNPDMSLGFWVNNNLVNSTRAKLTWSYKNGDQFKYNSEPQLPAFV